MLDYEKEVKEEVIGNVWNLNVLKEFIKGMILAMLEEEISDKEMVVKESIKDIKENISKETNFLVINLSELISFNLEFRILYKEKEDYIVIPIWEENSLPYNTMEIEGNI